MKAGLARALNSSIFFRGSVIVSHLEKNVSTFCFRHEYAPFKSISIAQKNLDPFIIIPFSSIYEGGTVDLWAGNINQKPVLNYKTNLF